MLVMGSWTQGRCTPFCYSSKKKKHCNYKNCPWKKRFLEPRWLKSRRNHCRKFSQSELRLVAHSGSWFSDMIAPALFKQWALIETNVTPNFVSVRWQMKQTQLFVVHTDCQIPWDGDEEWITLSMERPDDTQLRLYNNITADLWHHTNALLKY